MIVSRVGDYTRIAIHAQHIADAANVAYWTRDKQPTVTAMKEDDIVEDFKAMAALLGFELKKFGVASNGKLVLEEPVDPTAPYSDESIAACMRSTSGIADKLPRD